MLQAMNLVGTVTRPERIAPSRFFGALAAAKIEARSSSFNSPSREVSPLPVVISLPIARRHFYHRRSGRHDAGRSHRESATRRRGPKTRGYSGMVSDTEEVPDPA